MRDLDLPISDGAVDLVRIETAGAGAIEVPDAHQLFNATFIREGQDLVLHTPGHQDVRIDGYFAQSTAPDLVSPEGAVLRGALVERLAGPIAPGQYAQAGDAVAVDPIGQVEVIEGDAFAQRSDGTRVSLDIGAKVYANDVVTTGDGSKVSITFADGTIFSLASGSRMVLDDLVYTQNGNDNAATFNLIEGSFVFIAGEVAKTGDMEVTTPTATMGIRGTTVKVDMVAESGETRISLNIDPDGGKGIIEVYDENGNLIATITETNTMWIISPIDGETREVERTVEDYASDAEILDDAARAYAKAYGRVAGGENFVEQPSSTRGADPSDGIGDDGQQNDGGDDGDGNPPPDDGGDSSIPDDDGGVTNDGLEEETRFDEGDDGIQQAQNDVALGDEDNEIVIDVLANDEIGLTILAVADGSFGTTTLNADGTVTYVPAPDTSGTDTFTYTVSDENADTETVTVTVTVAPVNDAPVAGDDTASGPDNQALQITVLTNDTDLEGDTLSVASATNGALGSTQVNTDGTITYTPFAAGDTSEAFSLALAPAEAESAPGIVTDTFTYTLTDGNGGTDTASVTVTLTLINDPPVASDDATETSEDNAVTVTVLDNDGDPDGDLPFVVGAGDGAFGITTVNTDGTITYTPNQDANGTDTFSYTVSDGNGLTDTATVSVFVAPVNDPPVARDDAAEGREGQPLNIEVLVNDRDLDGDTVSVIAAGDGGQGTTTVNPNGTITYTPSEEAFGTDVFTYTVSDGNGATDTATVTIDIRPQVETVIGSVEPDLLEGGAGDEAIFGLQGSDTLDGGAGNDSLFGDQGADTLRGGDGDDFLSGGGVLGDLLEGGAGDDILEYSVGTDTFDGGTGRDTLLVVTGGAPGSDLLPVLSGSQIEAIDLNNGSFETLNIAYGDVVGLSSEADTVLEALLGAALPDSATILGDTGDTVNLTGDAIGGWQTGDTVLDDQGNDLTVYQFVNSATDEVLATLAIDDNVQVNLPTA